jgi:hypothetical protein
MRTLDDTQLETFDTEYVNEARWQIITACIDRDFPQGDFRFIDIGGGNGKFTDRLLAAYPNATGTVLDNSQLLLDRNTHNPRKLLLNASIENLETEVTQRYDIVFFNWVFHHLVGESYAESRRNIAKTLTKVETLLTDRGRLSIIDNMYNGSLVDGLPSWLIYQATSSKAIAKLVKKGGANTAGVGVCFLSRQLWHTTLRDAGLEILKYSDDEPWEIPWTWHALLHIDHICCGHFWAKP